MKAIPERTNVSARNLPQRNPPAAHPVVFRQLVANWPVVQAGRHSPKALSRLRAPVSIVAIRSPPAFGPASIKGGSSTTTTCLDSISSKAPPSSPQRSTASSNMAGKNSPLRWQCNRCPRARICRGSNPKTATRCLATSRRGCGSAQPASWRRIMILPKTSPVRWPASDASRCLHRIRWATSTSGPMNSRLPARPSAWWTSTRPTMSAFQSLKDALESAVYADLEPGDAIYHPYLWWHHVRSLAQMNMLVNYWWAPPLVGRGSPRDAFLHAMIEIKDLPPAHRDAWRVMFEHYVFKADGEPGAHLRADRRGLVGQADPDVIRSVRAALARVLGRT